MSGIPAPGRLTHELVEVGRHRLPMVRPDSAEELIDEDDYARDERLPYWAELWPSARALAGALAERALEGRSVLELGCGVGLPSLVALVRGARVLATDWYEEALRFAELNARRALGAELRTMLVDWRSPPAELLARAPFDLVVAADVLYEERNGRALAELLPRLAGPGGTVLIADPRRPDAAHLLGALTAAGWRQEVREVEAPGRPDESGSLIRLHELRPPSSGDGEDPVRASRNGSVR